MQGPTRVISPTADQLMRRMINVVGRLQTICQQDALDLGHLREDRKTLVAAAELDSRRSVDRMIQAAGGLAASTSLGKVLRSRASLSAAAPTTRPPRPAPSSLHEAIDEWRSIAGRAERSVSDFTLAHEQWASRMLKRAKTKPVLAEEVWETLARLDEIYLAIPRLGDEVVRAEVAAVTSAADRRIAEESSQRSDNQAAVAREAREAVEAVRAAVGMAGASWDDPRWATPTPASQVERFLRLGDLQVMVPSNLGLTSIPAVAAFPLEAGIAVGSDAQHRQQAIDMVRSLMLRVLAAVPPGDVHIKVIDPVALGQSVAEFRHLSEFDSSLLDEKTWTAERDIERVLDELSEHLEVVISTYLRGQFDSIDEYNEHAGEVAEPYRLITVFDYPAGFTERASRQLLSLIENGPRCGVYTLLNHESVIGDSIRQTHVSLARLTQSMQKITWSGGGCKLTLTEPVGDVSLSLVPDQVPPLTFDSQGNPETPFAALLDGVGRSVKRRASAAPSVTLDSLLPVLSRSRAAVRPIFDSAAPTFTTDPATWWTATSAESLVAPMGRSGAQGVASMHFSSTEVAGGAIMVGLPRSGKTTSLHAIILTLSMLYSPEELELYLIDAKHGVEFKIYENLPHARMVSVHSDRAFSLSVLKGIERRIQDRAEEMKAEGGGLSNLTEYRAATGRTMPRIVAIIDEFHELFEEPDAIGNEAFAAFSNIVRMGPFCGVHIILASQTLSAMPAMDRPTMLLLPQRVAFMCNEYDAEIVMGDQNKGPRLLSKTGQGIFNPSRGTESLNQLFQGLFVPPKDRAKLLRNLDRKAVETGWLARPRVFDGHVSVPRSKAAQPSGGRGYAVAVGEPMSLEEREDVVLRRTRGANLLLVGDTDDNLTDLTIRGVLHSSLIAASVQNLSVTVVDFLGEENTEGLTVMDVAVATGARYLRSRGVDAAVKELAILTAERLQKQGYRAKGHVLILVGLQRALSFAHVEHWDAPEGDSSPGAMLNAILRDGPEVGVHTILAVDRIQTVERRLGSEALQEMQMLVLGSAATQQDATFASGDYGQPAPISTGQLMIADQVRGTCVRARGYSPARPEDLEKEKVTHGR